MNHHVPDFEMDNDSSSPTPSTITRPKKQAMQDDELMELLWENGQVVMQSQRHLRKSSPPSKFEDAVLPTDQSTATREIRSSHDIQQHHLFMQEDEMASWLHCPLNDNNFDRDFCADLLYPTTPCITSTTTTTVTNAASPPLRSTTQNPETQPHPAVSAAVSAPRPPIPPARRAEVVPNFAHFSRHRGREVLESGPSNSKSVVRKSTVVDSYDTPTVRISLAAVARSADNTCGTMSGAAVAGTGSSAPAGSRERVTATCEMTATSSPGCSSASAEPPAQKAPVEDRKRKGREEETECHSEDAEFESADAKEQVRGSMSTKRTRAAEVHNLSERRRRDRINEKMRALQELIPRCNKSDKASMLDEAIEYLKSLQLQVQMMSMGCSMVPLMFPGIQQYMPPMGMGMGMGMGMSMGMGMGLGMEMGMNRPMMSFPNVLAGMPSATPAAAVHLGPRFPVPPFHMPPIPADPSRVQATNQADPMLNSQGAQSPNQPRVLNFADHYQHYLGLHQMHIPAPQNQAMAQPSASKPSTSRGAENLEYH